MCLRLWHLLHNRNRNGGRSTLLEMLRSLSLWNATLLCEKPPCRRYTVYDYPPAPMREALPRLAVYEAPLTPSHAPSPLRRPQSHKTARIRRPGCDQDHKRMLWLCKPPHPLSSEHSPADAPSKPHIPHQCCSRKGDARFTPHHCWRERKIERYPTELFPPRPTRGRKSKLTPCPVHPPVQIGPRPSLPPGTLVSGSSEPSFDGILLEKRKRQVYLPPRSCSTMWMVPPATTL